MKVPWGVSDDDKHGSWGLRGKTPTGEDVPCQNLTDWTTTNMVLGGLASPTGEDVQCQYLTDWTREGGAWKLGDPPRPLRVYTHRGKRLASGPPLGTELQATLS